MKKILSAMLILLAMAGCTKFKDQRTGNTSTSGLTTIVCDNSFENILQQEIEVYEYCYPKASVIPYYISEHAALDSLLQLKANLAVLTRELTPEQIKYLKGKRKTARTKRIAVDAIALIINKENNCDILSKKEISEILDGTLTEWNQISPSKLGKINVLFDNEGSSTVAYMRDSLLNGKPFGPQVYAQGSNQAVFEGVQKHRNAIGIIGVSWITSDLKNRAISTEDRVKASQASDTTKLDFSDDIKVVKVRSDSSIHAFKPYQAYIYSGEYPLYRSIYMVCLSVPGTTAHGFFSFVTGVQGQKLIQMTGILPATVRPRMVAVN